MLLFEKITGKGKQTMARSSELRPKKQEDIMEYLIDNAIRYHHSPEAMVFAVVNDNEVSKSWRQLLASQFGVTVDDILDIATRMGQSMKVLDRDDDKKEKPSA
jgi:hypothetical protein